VERTTETSPVSRQGGTVSEDERAGAIRGSTLPARFSPGGRLQQRVFNSFRYTYNELRPDEALVDETPASRWLRSSRPYPERILPPEYPAHLEVRRVSNAGCFRLHSGQIFLSQALNGEEIGLEEVQDGLWNIVYYDTLLGRFDDRKKRITGAPSLRGDCQPCPRTFC
jgi:hypothetical protein